MASGRTFDTTKELLKAVFKVHTMSVYDSYNYFYGLHTRDPEYIQKDIIAGCIKFIYDDLKMHDADKESGISFDTNKNCCYLYSDTGDIIKISNFNNFIYTSISCTNISNDNTYQISTIIMRVIARILQNEYVKNKSYDWR